MLTAAVRLFPDVGVKVIMIVQLAFMLSEAPQVFV
jgi:hypothetical protein